MRASKRSAIYAIIHLRSGRIYVGSAQDLVSRWDHHRCRLVLGAHVNRYLQHAWTKHGADAFEWRVLEDVPGQDLLIREQWWMDRLAATKRATGFNICPTAGSQAGKPVSQETRAKLSAAGKGKRHTPETKARISASKMGNPGRPAFGLNQRSLTEEMAASIKREMAAGVSGAAIARDRNIPLHTIGRLASGKTYPNVLPELNGTIRHNRPEWRRGQIAGRAKLTEQDVLAIDARLKAGESCYAIAKDLGLGRGTVWAIKQRQNWRHLLSDD